MRTAAQQKTRRDGRALMFERGGWSLGAGFGNAALVAGRGVLVHEALASGAIEQLDGGALDVGRRVGGVRLLQGSPQRGTLRTVAHGRRARLTHVLLRGCNVRHEKISKT